MAQGILKGTASVKVSNAVDGGAGSINLGATKDTFIDAIESDDSDTAIAAATKADSFGRALVAITTSSYGDVEVSNTYSAVAILNE